jgi:hypothetical protein
MIVICFRGKERKRERERERENMASANSMPIET